MVPTGAARSRRELADGCVVVVRTDGTIVRQPRLPVGSGQHGRFIRAFDAADDGAVRGTSSTI